MGLYCIRDMNSIFNNVQKHFLRSKAEINNFAKWQLFLVLDANNDKNANENNANKNNANKKNKYANKNNNFTKVWKHFSCSKGEVNNFGKVAAIFVLNANPN